MVVDGTAGQADEDRLYGLMEVAERQQATVQQALEGLAAERLALAREREELAHGVRNVQVGAQGAVRSAVAESLAGAATEGVAAVQAATKPLLARLAEVTEQAGHADAALRGVVGWASWKLLGRGTLVVVVLAGLAWGAQLSVWWWASWDTSVLQARKALLQAEVAGLQGQVAEMQANRDEWARAGMLARLERCDPGSRPCVRINEAAGVFRGQGHSDYRVLLGY